MPQTATALLDDDEPLTAATIAALASVEMESLSDADVARLMASWGRARAYADGQIARAVLALRQRAPRCELISTAQLVAAEVAASLSLGMGGADRLVSTAVGLAERFPATLAAVESGAVSWAKATSLVEQAAVLDADRARQVEERVLPRAAERTPAQHADAVRRAVDRVDPEAAARRRAQAMRDVELIRTHVGDGMGELFARMASEQLDAVWLGADAWARRRKARGDARTLGKLRVAALVQWAQSFLVHGDPARCDDVCDRAGDDTAGDDTAGDDTAGDDTAGDDTAGDDTAGDGADVRAPTRHGRAVRLRVVWDLASLLGLADDCGELADSGATLPPDAVRDLLDGGAAVRRLLVDAASGELVDLTPARYFRCSPDDSRDERRHCQPVELHVVATTDQWDELQSGAGTALTRAVTGVDADLRALLLSPLNADGLDASPNAYPAPARLAEFIGARDRHPTNPSAGRSAATAGDLDHVVSFRAGGRTVRDNLHSPTRRWHRLRTYGGWTVVRRGRGWLWRSWTGRTVTTRPYDYRLGP
jgi:hypothetical protein